MACIAREIMNVVDEEDVYVLNYCAKYLARSNSDARQDFGQYDAGDPRGNICEPWRFPLVDTYSDGTDPAASYAFNQVTFVYRAPGPLAGPAVAVVGTFANLYEPIPLRPIPDTPYFTLTLVVPKAQVHHYKFLVAGQPTLDPINPQRVVLDNGQAWSRFFTHLATEPIVFERWELAILSRLSEHILPFETAEARNFLSRFYDAVDRQAKETQYVHAYRLDQPVGIANYIDKLVAKEEAHHLVDYRIGLALIDQLLRRRNPYVEPREMSKEMYRDLYEQMASGTVPGWNYERYANPAYLLQVMRRHMFTGAFSHPKYGGNSGAAAWAYLEEKYRDANGATLFNWRRIMERPLGDSVDYHG
jgi:gluconate 2-dehydrogenase subunit 3-like protein